MDNPPSPDLVAEQEKLREELIARFGEQTFTRALEMSGIRMCLQALAVDGLSEDERKACYIRAGMHLAKLQASFMAPGESVALTECAKRIDAAMDAWMFDEIEARDGLPTAPGLYQVGKRSDDSAAR